MADITEVTGLLEEYVKLEKNIEVLKMTEGMTQEILGESQDYRALINLQYELKRQVLNGAEIIEIYRYVKNTAEQKINFYEEDKNKIIEKNKNEKNKINELIGDLEKIIQDKQGTIIKEIKEKINEYK